MSGAPRYSPRPIPLSAPSNPAPPARVARAVRIVDLPILLEGRRRTAEMLLTCVADRRAGRRGPPILATSMNGHTIYEALVNAEVRALFARFDLNSMDGQPAVILSRRFWPEPFVERVATTDLVHDVVSLGADARVRHFIVGAKPEIAARAAGALQAAHPRMVLAGVRHGYFPDKEIPRLAFEIESAAAEIVWLCLGVPREQRVALALSRTLTQPAIIKTGGGLLDFLSGVKPRAPAWMQRAGMEWCFRLGLEPGRLFARYAISSPVAFAALLAMKPVYEDVPY